jgi:hypothetical protein
MLPGKNINQCMTCHQRPAGKVHENNKLECSQCHSADRWRPATLDHAKYFRFDKEHKPDCATCHQNNNYKEYTCYGCHEHSPDKIRGEHLEEGINKYQNCAPCHRSGDDEEAKHIFRSEMYHDRSGSSFEGGNYDRGTGYGSDGYPYETREDDGHDRPHNKHDKDDDD